MKQTMSRKDGFHRVANVRGESCIHIMDAALRDCNKLEAENGIAARYIIAKPLIDNTAENGIYRPLSDIWPEQYSKGQVLNISLVEETTGRPVYNSASWTGNEPT